MEQVFGARSQVSISIVLLHIPAPRPLPPPLTTGGRCNRFLGGKGVVARIIHQELYSVLSVAGKMMTSSFRNKRTRSGSKGFARMDESPSPPQPSGRGGVTCCYNPFAVGMEGRETK
ncbi:hypothetical protein NPIL_215871 [Nephila pilipes]|uniref:Uncharacterized protein n=1 Tax=Nephila pilipes TaxID=299642 RepID=A0A8X6TH89_NEPPI|nr:hypothetical protein NPIL_215871 [Nephila pilipes]